MIKLWKVIFSIFFPVLSFVPGGHLLQPFSQSLSQNSNEQSHIILSSDFSNFGFNFKGIEWALIT